MVWRYLFECAHFLALLLLALVPKCLLPGLSRALGLLELFPCFREASHRGAELPLKNRSVAVWTTPLTQPLMLFVQLGEVLPLGAGLVL